MCHRNPSKGWKLDRERGMIKHNVQSLPYILVLPFAIFNSSPIHRDTSCLYGPINILLTKSQQRLLETPQTNLPHVFQRPWMQRRASHINWRVHLHAVYLKVYDNSTIRTEQAFISFGLVSYTLCRLKTILRWKQSSGLASLTINISSVELSGNLLAKQMGSMPIPRDCNRQVAYHFLPLKTTVCILPILTRQDPIAIDNPSCVSTNYPKVVIACKILWPWQTDFLMIISVCHMNRNSSVL